MSSRLNLAYFSVEIEKRLAGDDLRSEKEGHQVEAEVGLQRESSTVGIYPLALIKHKLLVPEQTQHVTGPS